MNDLSFPGNKSTEISFKIGIAGTTAAPSKVRVMLEQGDDALSFAAKNVGDSWTSVIEQPGRIFDGEVKLSICVHLNNQVFVPYHCQADISSGVEVTASLAPDVPDAPIAAAPRPAPVFVPPAPITFESVKPAKPITLPIKTEEIKAGLLQAMEQKIEKVKASVKPKTSPIQEEREPTQVFKLRKTAIVYK